MLKVKFKGQKINTNEWVEGTYHYSDDGKYHYILNLEKFNERPHPNDVEGLDEMCLFKSEVHEVIPETVELLKIYDWCGDPINEMTQKVVSDEQRDNLGRTFDNWAEDEFCR